jgi:hypothetical protein
MSRVCMLLFPALFREQAQTGCASALTLRVQNAVRRGSLFANSHILRAVGRVCLHF